MNAPLYTTEILRLAASLPEPVSLERIDGAATERSPACGSVVTTQLMLGEDGRVEAFSQQVQACAFGQAAAAIVANGAHGRDLADVRAALEQLDAWLSGSSDQPPAWPGFAVLAPARSRRSRHGAILLPLKALSAAMERAR